MTHSFKLSRRIARFRAPAMAAAILAFTACDTTNSLDPNAGAPPETAVPSGAGDAVSLSVSYAGGIPIGITAMPTTEFGTRYNGALRNIWPGELLSNLAAIKAKGGKVILMLVGNDSHYKDGGGHFSLTKWKARVDRFKGVNFSSYINDGTVVAHFLVDEPNDPTNWNGILISQATLDEMARYSKQLWPNLSAVVRAESSYLAKWSGSYRYLDGAWAQYVQRKGDVNAFIARNIADAQKKGLALVVGLNISKGGLNKGRMTPTQIKTWGAALLNTTYPCAFISWKYDANMVSSSSVQDAMSSLRSKAQNRPAKSCRHS